MDWVQIKPDDLHAPTVRAGRPASRLGSGSEPPFGPGRLGALRTLPPFIAIIWRTSPALTLATAGLRLARAVLPIATLFVGKLIIDEVVRRCRAAGASMEAGPGAECRPHGGPDLPRFTFVQMTDQLLVVAGGRA